MTVTNESLYKTPWVELMKRTSDEDGTYIYIREPWLINGQAVSILPYRVQDGRLEYLVRCEMAESSVVGTIKGGCDKEGESVVNTAVRELIEEAGYTVEEWRLFHLGTVRTSKLNTTIMHLFTVDLTGFIQGEALGDGTMNERNAYCKWISHDKAIDLLDPVIHASILRGGFHTL